MTQYRWPVEGKTYVEDDPKTYDPKVEFKGRNYVLRDGNLIPLELAKSDHGLIEHYEAPEPVANFPTADAALLAIKHFEDQAREQLLKFIGKGEVDGWPVKFSYATAWRADNSLVFPMLVAEAELTGETMQELTDSIIDKAPGYETFSGQMAGMRRKFTPLILAVTPAELEADPFAYDAIIEAAKTEALPKLAAFGVVMS